MEEILPLVCDASAISQSVLFSQVHRDGLAVEVIWLNRLL